jgi:hypothetical protein
MSDISIILYYALNSCVNEGVKLTSLNSNKSMRAKSVNAMGLTPLRTAIILPVLFLLSNSVVSAFQLSSDRV